MLRVTIPFCWLSWNKGGGRRKKRKKNISCFRIMQNLQPKKKSDKHMQNTIYKLVISEKMCMLAVNQMEELATIY